MADWTELDTNGLLPGEPFTSAKALAFFENPVAMAGGAVDAPRNVLKSIERIAAGAFTRATRSESFTGIEDRVILELGLLQIGTVRVAFTSGGLASKTIVRRRAGSNTTLVSGTGSLSVDASVIPGDLITCTGTGAASQISFTATFSTNGENLWPAGGNGGEVVNNDV